MKAAQWNKGYRTTSHYSQATGATGKTVETLHCSFMLEEDSTYYQVDSSNILIESLCLGVSSNL